MIKNLIVRTLSGAVFVAIMVASILYPPYLFGVVFLVLTMLGMREFYSLCGKNDGTDVGIVASMIAGGAVFVSAFCSLFLQDFDCVFSLAIVSVAIIFVLELFRKKSAPIRNISISMMGLVYVALPFVAMAFMERIDPIFLLAFFVVIWASDTGAYLTGMCFGKHKMFERISPKKTWEGLSGGLVFALAVGYFFSEYCSTQISVVQWICFAFVVFVSGTLGDLVESLFKRTLGVKDSGKLMPGHGGMLDRFDSSLLAAPIAYALLRYMV